MGIHFQLRTVKLRLKVQEDLLGVIKLQYRPVNHNPGVIWQQKTVILYLKKRVLQLNFELQILLTVSVCNVRRRYNITAICNHCYHNWKKNSNLFSYIYSLALKLAFAKKKSILPSSKKKFVNNINRIIHQSKSLTLMLK